MTGIFINRCPAMTVRPTSDSKVRMTTVLYTDIKIVIGAQWISGWLRFPETPITKAGILTAVVAPCSAVGILEGIGSVYMALDQERVIGPEALPVQGKGKFILDGKWVNIAATYPAVLSVPEWDIEKSDWLVGAVQADGTITTD